MTENFFGQNIKLLRKRNKRTQEDVADALNMKRSTLSGYENGIAEPGIDALIAFSAYYRVAVDTLLRINLKVLADSELYQLEHGSDIFLKGNNLRVLTTTVDSKNRENIEVVNQKASAGYRTGFADPEFIRVLPTFQMPFLSRDKKYRTFQINGDSMLPIPSGSWVTGEYIQNWKLLRDGTASIILTVDDGIVFKIIENRSENEGILILHSLNTDYEPYRVDVRDIREIWKFVHYISSALPEPNLPIDQMGGTLATLRSEIAEIRSIIARQGNLFEGTGA